MKKISSVIMMILITITLCGCNNMGRSNVDFSEYRGGIKLDNLLDENTYKKNGAKMVRALENMINASPNDFHMLKKDPKLFSDAVSFEETFEESDCDYYYVGKIKDKKPDGYGVLTSGYESDNVVIYYIGEFKNGEIKDCYGLKLEGGIAGGIEDNNVVYEGDLAYLTDSELYPVPADGEQQLLYDINAIYNYYDYAERIPYEELTADKYEVSRCIPWYVGEIKKGKPNGKGIYYDRDGFIEYEGESKNGQKHGKGKLYSQGELIKEGTFKYGELEDGKVYREAEEGLGNIVDDMY